MLYTLKMTLSGSESPPGHPQSLVLRFVGFTHSACHYYSQLLTTTQIGLATTLMMMMMMIMIMIILGTNPEYVRNPKCLILSCSVTKVTRYLQMILECWNVPSLQNVVNIALICFSFPHHILFIFAFSLHLFFFLYSIVFSLWSDSFSHLPLHIPPPPPPK